MPCKIPEALSRAFLQVHKIFFVSIPKIVVVVGEVHLVHNTNDFGSIAVFADDVARIAPFGEKRCVGNRGVEPLINDAGRLAGAHIWARDNRANGKRREHLADCGGLAFPRFA